MKGLFLWRASNFFVSFLTLFLGTSIYLTSRDTSLMVFSWAEYIGLNGQVLVLKDLLIQYQLFRIEFVRFNMPDMFWVMSFTSAFNIVWGPHDNLRYYWMLLPVFIAIVSEFLQRARMLSGTYDFLDLLSYVLGFILILLIDKLLRLAFCNEATAIEG